MLFIGIDLGWQSGGSGVCCLDLRVDQLHLIALEHFAARENVLQWLDEQVPPQAPALIAVDAPTLIPNETGMRLCDRLAHRYFGQYDAGCYPANQGRPFAPALIEFGIALENRGFCHAPEIQAREPGRYQIELFPHPATIHLFKLNRILKYKKGRLGDRRHELEKLRNYQLSILPQLLPSLPLTPEVLPAIPLRGKAVKQVEDQLDSVTCAYAGAHWWWWGRERNWVLGNGETGYIVVIC
jgi:predicted RNase H-like nuclease